MFTFGIFRGSFEHFYTLTGFCRHFMCIIQIWTTCTSSSAYKLVKKIKYVSFGACFGPMQEMGMNFKHQGTVDCWQNVEILCFWILVNPKLVWNSWNLACYNGMAPDMLWYFSCPFWEKAHSNNSQQRHFETNSCHCNISNVLYNLNWVRSVNHSRDATPHYFNG